MKNFTIKGLFTKLCVLLMVGGTMAQETPKNIIVFISDGWGYNHIAATNYYNGVETATYENFENNWPMSTYSSSVKKIWEDTITGYTTGYNSFKCWTDWKWMKRNNDGGMCATGSAPAATAMASGKKSTKYAIGMDCDSNRIELITERAIELGKRAGVVSSVQFAHATPAGFSAHNCSRKAYAEIARNQIIDSKLSVIMGCGNPDYNDNAELAGSKTSDVYKYVGGEETWNHLLNGDTEFTVESPDGNTVVQDVDGDGMPDAWTLIQDSALFAQYANGEVPERVIGVPHVRSTLQYSRDGDVVNTSPYEVAYNAGLPRLHQMTTAALNVLNSHDGDAGFFLMVEGGAVDWAGHGNSLGRIIEEQTDFNQAVDSTIAWLTAAGELENTLIIVTGDHETGYLVGTDFDTLNLNMVEQYPVIDNGAGNMPGAKFMSNNVYNTLPEYPYGEHTNQLVPLYAKGPGADVFGKYADQEDFVRGRYIDNTDLGHGLFDLWKEEDHPQPKNIFLFISDGWSRNHLDAANYFMGESQEFENWDACYMSTYSATLDKNWETIDSSFNSYYNPAYAWTQEDWIKRDGGAGATGSAPAATSMYTGVKTAKYAIGVDIDGEALKTFGERANEIGKSSGVVSSVQFSHATPGAMFAHNSSRKNYAQIANEMLLDSRATVIMGCGAPDYDDDGQMITPDSYKYVGGEGSWNNILEGATTWDSLSVNNNNVVQDVDGDDNPDAWTIIRDVEAFDSLASGKTPLRVLGIPKVYHTLQYDREDNSDVAFEDAFNADVPTLVQMTKAAINVLDNNENGFSLMVEGGAVDWAGHGNDLDRVIEEQNDFNKSVDAAIDWVETNSNWDETLIIVTGDHETGYLVGPNWDGNNAFETYPLTDNGANNMPGGQFLSGDHTNMLIPLFSKGCGTEVLMDYADHHDYYRKSYLDNTEIGQSILKMWENMPDADPNIDTDDIITNIENKETSNISVYPSSTSNLINIESDEYPALVKIVSTSGQVVMLQSLNSHKSCIQLSNLNKGTYIVVVKTETSESSQRVIKL